MADEKSPLQSEIRRRIELAGPMPVAQYMALCLTHPEHGYYTTRDPLGAAGDFITAPEISQMFGELIGLWMAAAWRAIGSPENIRLVEIGPGRGTMMLDALRAARVMPDFRKAIVLHLVEINPTLERLQRQAFVATTDVPVSWHHALADVPDGPLIILANEFFDALPIHQAVMCADGWHERVVKVGADGHFHFSIDRDPIPLFDELLPRDLRAAKIGEIFEWRTDQMALEIGRRVRSNGVALITDYGHAESAIGDTLQAVGGHEFVDPLVTPGQVDLTAHVDFQALARAAEGMRARVHGPIEQREFLRRLGIEQRAAALKAAAPPEHAVAVQAALERLTSAERTGMGRLIKAMAISDAKIGPLPGFET